MYTWLVELIVGLNGVLSTVTVSSPYGSTIAAQLIRLRKDGWIPMLFGRVNLELKGGPRNCLRHYRAGAGRSAKPDSWLLKHGGVTLRSSRG